MLMSGLHFASKEINISELVFLPVSNKSDGEECDESDDNDGRIHVT